MRAAVLGHAALTLALAAACGDDESAGQDDGAGAAPDAISPPSDHDRAPEATLTPTQVQRRYLSGWTQCVHRTGQRVEQAWTRYGNTVDEETGTPKDKDTLPFVYRVSVELEACRGLEAPPEGVDAGLPGAGNDYVTATGAVAGFTRDLSAYYDAKAYEQDDWAKGKATAAEFRAAYEGWTAQRTAFVGVLDTARGRVEQARLDELEKAGEHGLRFEVARLSLWARTAAACVAREEAPAQACSNAAGDFFEVHAELDAFARKNPADAIGVFWLDVVRRKSTAFEGALREATTEPAKKRRPKTPPPEPQADPRRIAVEQAFRELEVAGDRVRFDFP